MKIKKVIAIAVTTLAIALSASAENFDWSKCWQNYGGTVKEKDFIVNVGLGLSTDVFADLDSKTDWRTPYMEISAEFTKKIWVLPFGFGGYFGYSGYGVKEEAHSYGVYVKSTASRNYINLGALVNYHVQLPVEKLDVYTGIRTGVKIRHDESEYESNSPYIGNGSDKDTKSFFYLDYKIGATYYFTKLLGANLETGYPVYLKTSLSLKF